LLEKLSSLSKSLAKHKEVVAVVLYGSVARGEVSKKSDVDLLIVVDRRNAELERKLNQTIERHRAGWRVVQTVLTPVELTENPYYAFEVLKDGILLYKRPNVLELPFALPERAITIFTFDMSKRSQRERAKLDRALYGIIHKKRLKSGKVEQYRYAGVVERLGGRTLGKGCFYVPAKGEAEIEKILKQHRASYKKARAITIAELGG
jgi:predicted nucleotidyltransferase